MVLLLNFLIVEKKNNETLVVYNTFIFLCSVLILFDY